MKKILILSILLSFLAINQNYGAIGCQEKSWHMKKKYDRKNWHPVQCNCQCHKYPQAPDGTCSKCGHRHEDPRLGLILLPESEKLEKKVVIRWRVLNKIKKTKNSEAKS